MSWLLFGTGCAPISSARKIRPRCGSWRTKELFFAIIMRFTRARTNVNGTALVTGAYPGHSGLIANHDYRPEIDSKHSIDVEIPKVVEKGDQLSGGKYISFPTIAEIVQDASGRTAIATAKTVGLLLDRHVNPSRGKNCVTLFAGESRPRDALSRIADALGPFPPFGQFTQGDKWTTKAITEILWKDSVPTFSLLWLGSRILRNMDPRQVRNRRSLRLNLLMKILLLSFRR